MTPNRRDVLLSGGAVAGLGLVGCANPGSVIGQPLVTTANGRLRGGFERGVNVFRGIPYAGSVSGPAQRFKAPPPPPSWTGVRDTVEYGPASLQFVASGSTSAGKIPPAEDCLSLNVWTPAADGQKRPVMFYTHGGGFSTNSGNYPWVNGANLARLNDVVVVTHNHRLGAMGYLYLGQLLGPEYQGNQGLQDIAAALRWVSENISEFGGDPDNILIFGESGGAAKTMCLYAMPSAAPYFAKAAFQSGGRQTYGSPDEATEVTRYAMRTLGIDDPRTLLEMPASDLLAFQVEAERSAASQSLSNGEGGSIPIRFWPLVDGLVLPETPFKNGAPKISANKPIIVGSTKDETVFFGLGDPSIFSLTEDTLRERLSASLGDKTDEWIDLYRTTRPGSSPSQLYIAITTSLQFRAGHVQIAEDKVKQGSAPTYSYLLQYQSPVPFPGTDYPVGALHASDILAVFNNAGPQPGVAADAVRPPFNDASPDRLKTAANMSAMWAAFARHGDPSIPGQPTWEPFTLARRETMLIDAECKMVSDPESEERQFWQS